MINLSAPKLSIVIPVHNEEAHLGACLSSLKFADEVIIVLDKCTDRSKEIALQHGAKTIEGSWEIEGERRMLGINATTNPWLLEIDADERVTPELATEIRQILEQPQHALYRIKFDNHIGDKLVRYGWGAHVGVTSGVRLFKRDAKRYEFDRVHPRAIMTGTIGHTLTHPIIHYMDKHMGDTFKRFDNYTTRRAKDLIDKNINEPMGRNVRRFFTRFLKCFIMRKGYREGAMGFFVATLAGLYPLVSALKAKYKLF